jgi:hypothetical protein
LLKILKEYLKYEIILSYVCDVKKDANDNQIIYGIKQYPATILMGKNITVIISAKIANNIRVTVAKNLLG